MIDSACLSEDTILSLADGTLIEAGVGPAELHLDKCPSCRRLLAAVSRTGSGAATEQPAAGELRDPEDELPIGRGTAVGRYLVTTVLGAGGMGTVYAAYDPELDRRVALKLVHDRAPQPDRAAREDRLRREARAMARLVHPNVVRVYDVGVHGSRTFISMELVEGRTLRSWLRQPRPWREVVSVLIEAGRGLQAAHDAGMLHRDFKPDNVFVARGGQVKVGDFGLARAVERDEPLLEGAGDPDGRGSRTSELCGTPGYLAPEVIAGDPHSIASDQFAYCVSLWEALYARRPFAGKTPIATLEQVRAGAVEPPPTRSVPGWLRQALLRGLASDPGSRHASMGALLDVLERRPRARLLFAGAAALVLAALTLSAFAGGRLATLRCAGIRAELSPAWSDRRRAALETAFRRAGQQAPWARVEGALSRFAESWVNVRRRSCRAARVEGDESEDALRRRTRCLGGQRDVVAALGELWLSGPPALLAEASAAASSLPVPAVCGGDAPLNAPSMPDPPPTIGAQVDELRRGLARAAARLLVGDAEGALSLSREASRAATTLRYEPLEAEATLQVGAALALQGQAEQAERALRDAALSAIAARHERVLAEALVRLARVLALGLARPEEGQLVLARAALVVTRLGDRKLQGDLEQLRGQLRPQARR